VRGFHGVLLGKRDSREIHRRGMNGSPRGARSLSWLRRM
jgi:hypothetical protein